MGTEYLFLGVIAIMRRFRRVSETPAERSEFIEHFSITKKRAGHPVKRLN